MRSTFWAKWQLWGSQFSKSWNWPEILAKTRKQFGFHENCTKCYFQVMRSTFRPNRIFERQSFQNRETGLKFSSKRENSALSMKIVQNGLFRLCAARFGQMAFGRVKVLKIVKLASNSPQNGKTVRFQWKLYKTVLSGHPQHVLAKSQLWASNFSKSSHWPKILFKTRKQCALGMKIVENALFRSCHVLAKSHFWASKFSKSVILAWNALQNSKTVRFSWKLYKMHFSGHAQHVLAKWHLWGLKVLKIVTTGLKFSLKTGKQCAFPNENCTKRSYQDIRSTFWPNRNCEHQTSQNRPHWPKILFKTRKQFGFHENCTKCYFQVMRSTFRPNCICERQSFQNRETGLKFSSKRENSALSMKIVPNALYGSCAARFGQIAFLSVKVFKIVTLVWNSLQKGKTVRFYKNCTRRCFRVMRSTFWPNRTFERQSSQNRHTSLKFSSKRENSALSMKIVQNGLFRSCAARFGQMAFVRVKVLKIVTLAWNSLQNEENSALSMKIVQNAIFRSCAARFGQMAFVRVKVLKIVKLAWNSLQNGKTVRFPWKLYKMLFSGHAQHV